MSRILSLIRSDERTAHRSLVSSSWKLPPRLFHVGDARKNLGPEELDGFHQTIMWQQAVVDPREDPPHRQALRHRLDLTRHGVNRPDKREAFVEKVGLLSGGRIDQALRKAEQLEPVMTAEVAAVAPQLARLIVAVGDDDVAQHAQTLAARVVRDFRIRSEERRVG